MLALKSGIFPETATYQSPLSPFTILTNYKSLLPSAFPSLHIGPLRFPLAPVHFCLIRDPPPHCRTRAPRCSTQARNLLLSSRRSLARRLSRRDCRRDDATRRRGSQALSHPFLARDHLR